MRDLPIRGESIRLGQALKLSGLAESGGEARALVEDGAVTVNAEVETRRGRQLRHGDVVAVGDEALRIAGVRPLAVALLVQEGQQLALEAARRLPEGRAQVAALARPREVRPRLAPAAQQVEVGDVGRDAPERLGVLAPRDGHDVQRLLDVLADDRREGAA